MRYSMRILGKWVLRAGVVALVLVALDVAILAYPAPLFAHKARFGEFTVFSDQPIAEGFGQVIDGVRMRVSAMENAQPGSKVHVFICGNERLYGLFAFLTRRTSNSMGIGLYAFGNVYLNESKIQRVATGNTAGIRHSRFEGAFDEAIAHEIAHFNVVRALGYRRAMAIPAWKSEGYAEYQANLAATRADSSYVFADRIDLLRDNAVWGRGVSWARSAYEWQALVEFLGDVRGLGLNDLLDEGVTESWARREMLAWYGK
jgi:hypothetical protein